MCKSLVYKQNMRIFTLSKNKKNYNETHNRTTKNMG